MFWRKCCVEHAGHLFELVHKGVVGGFEAVGYGVADLFLFEVRGHIDDIALEESLVLFLVVHAEAGADLAVEVVEVKVARGLNEGAAVMIALDYVFPEVVVFRGALHEVFELGEEAER